MKKAKLEEWEFNCEECNGTGYESALPSPKSPHFKYMVKCKCCHGEGKLDWIENIVGKKDEDIEEMINRLSEKMAKKFADKIDKEILETITEEAEKNNNEKIKNGGNFFDYRKVC